MNNEELDRLVAESMYRNDDVRALDLQAGEADLMENIMTTTAPTLERPQPILPTPPRRRRKLFTGLALAGTLAVGGGVAFAVVTDRLSPEQAQLVEDIGSIGEPTCGLDTENARLVATTTSGERTVDYWTVDGPNSHGDFLFENGTQSGGAGCGPISRSAAYPELPWANYTFTADPRDGTGLGNFTFFGQAPPGTATVDIVMNLGTVTTEIDSPDGYFVVLAALPFQAPPPPGESTEPPAAPPMIDTLERVDAFAPDGTLLDSGGLGG